MTNIKVPNAIKEALFRATDSLLKGTSKAFGEYERNIYHTEFVGATRLLVELGLYEEYDKHAKEMGI